ncbi:MAG: hypothetical protein K6E95_00395 [Lachnospiraceae bacterium]|nr:hypothetical protein [Lachnospiraceae bacterium]
MKFRFKVIIIVGIFIASVVFFGSDITETMFSSAADTTLMASAKLPTITIEVAGQEFNLLHGYAANLDPMVMRETITPIGPDKTLTLLIHHTELNVRKMKYEIIREDGGTLEEGSLTVLDVSEGPKKVPITFSETFKTGEEYITKFTLITNEGKRIYYYTRIKVYDDGKLTEKLNYAEYFHDTLIYGQEGEKSQLKKYLEPWKDYDNSNFAHVTIHSSFEMVSWGQLDPEVLWEEAPAITEFYNNFASIKHRFIVRIKTGSGLEIYNVTENIRFQYTDIRTYLYNYDRVMEAYVDVANTSLMKDEFKLGITNDIHAQTVYGPEGRYIAFVHGSELFEYDAKENLFYKAFSFKDGEDYERTYFEDHSVRILRMHDNGDTDFIVYGYMNRGEYEGRVGIALYRFVVSDNRIEEQLYVPLNTSYSLLLSDMTDFAFLSEFDVFYFSLHDSVYEYSLVTRQVRQLAADVPDGNMVFVEDELYLVWQTDSDILKSKQLQLFDLKKNEITQLTAPKNETIRLLGRINDNFIYGYQRISDRYINADGSTILPSYKICISDGHGNVLKEYMGDDYYIRDVEPGDGILVINRLKKHLGINSSYYPIEPDSIVNLPTTVERSVNITRRVTDRTLTEYYVSLPSGIDIVEIPRSFTAEPTVIDFDTTTRVAESDNMQNRYYAYSFGRIIEASSSAAKAIAAADEGVGTVIDRNGQVVWERGIKNIRAEIKDIRTVRASVDLDSRKAAMKMLLEYRSVDADPSDYSREKESMYSWLQRKLKTTVVDLTGITLDEMLYYVYKGRPVIAIRPDGDAVVVYGYDSTSISVYDPLRDRTYKNSLKDAAQSFSTAGNIFISYLD